jgi:hypothetical protein
LTLTVAATALAACDTEERKQSAARTAPETSTARTAAARPAKPRPHRPAKRKGPAPGSPAAYVPSARHAHRPPHSIYDDEVGENVLQADRGRIHELFGDPLKKSPARDGLTCWTYKIVHESRNGWFFCFKPNGKMDSAMAIHNKRPL